MQAARRSNTGTAARILSRQVQGKSIASDDEDAVQLKLAAILRNRWAGPPGGGKKKQVGGQQAHKVCCPIIYSKIAFVSFTNAW